MSTGQYTICQRQKVESKVFDTDTFDMYEVLSFFSGVTNFLLINYF